MLPLTPFPSLGGPIGRWDLVIHPLSEFRRSWDLLLLLLIIYTLFAAPFRMAFYWDHNALGAFFVWETVVDFLFLTDFALNLNTGYILFTEQAREGNPERTGSTSGSRGWESGGAKPALIPSAARGHVPTPDPPEVLDLVDAFGPGRVSAV